MQDATPSSDTGAELDLLIVQSTRFCNINCDYCYLPDRDAKGVMSEVVLLTLFRRLAEAPDYIKNGFTLCWHAGEPLAAGIQFYRNATAILRESLPPSTHVQQSIQTNGTLLTEEWCQFFLENDFRVGLSLDGPEAIHDSHRRTRSGRGTHAQVLHGLRLLQSAGVNASVIAVLTPEGMSSPGEFYNFFAEAGVTRVGINIAEAENANATSTALNPEMEDLCSSFLAHVYRRSIEDGRVVIRELDAFESDLARVERADRSEGDRRSTSHLLDPMAILTCDIHGNVSTFSPELLGAKSAKYGDFVIGNVSVDAISDMAASETLEIMTQDVALGVGECESRCDYFGVCRGGAPSNKFFEHGTFAASETSACRFSRKLTINAALDAVEQKLRLVSISAT